MTSGPVSREELLRARIEQRNSAAARTRRQRRSSVYFQPSFRALITGLNARGAGKEALTNSRIKSTKLAVTHRKAMAAFERQHKSDLKFAAKMGDRMQKRLREMNRKAGYGPLALGADLLEHHYGGKTSDGVNINAMSADVAGRNTPTALQDQVANKFKNPDGSDVGAEEQDGTALLQNYIENIQNPEVDLDEDDGAPEPGADADQPDVDEQPGVRDLTVEEVIEQVARRLATADHERKMIDGIYHAQAGKDARADVVAKMKLDRARKKASLLRSGLLITGLGLATMVEATSITLGSVKNIVLNTRDAIAIENEKKKQRKQKAAPAPGTP